MLIRRCQWGLMLQEKGHKIIHPKVFKLAIKKSKIVINFLTKNQFLNVQIICLEPGRIDFQFQTVFFLICFPQLFFIYFLMLIVKELVCNISHKFFTSFLIEESSISRSIKSHYFQVHTARRIRRIKRSKKKSSLSNLWPQGQIFDLCHKSDAKIPRYLNDSVTTFNLRI